MDTQATAMIPRPFTQIPDLRRANRRHKLGDILTIALFAVICGADGWAAVAQYGRAKFAWLQTFLELPHGIPSHDTFTDVFAKLQPDVLERCFMAWMKTLVQLSGGKLVAIDGKSLRRSFEHGWDKSGMAHMVSAFVQANQMVFAQVQTQGKGQELSGIEQLLHLLELDGAVVTLDALGCQKEIAQQILQAHGQYILHVKDNQPTLHAKLQATFTDLILDQFAGVPHDYFTQTDGGHDRIEIRRLWVCWDVHLLGELAAAWPGLKSLIVVERTRTINGHTSVERHYYISSLDRRTKAKRLAGYIRGHWSVENNLHDSTELAEVWQLDVSFREDERRIRKGHGAENFSRLCRIALNLLKNEPTQTVGITIKRQICGWNNDYLLKVVAA
jgi:predicted transposase YbfD/YdcC